MNDRTLAVVAALTILGLWAHKGIEAYRALLISKIGTNEVGSGLPAIPKNLFWSWAWNEALKVDSKPLAKLIAEAAPAGSLQYVGSQPDSFFLDGRGVYQYLGITTKAQMSEVSQ